MKLRICPFILNRTCKTHGCPHGRLHKEVHTLTICFACDHDGTNNGGCPPCKHLKDLPKKIQMELLIKDF